MTAGRHRGAAVPPPMPTAREVAPGCYGVVTALALMALAVVVGLVIVLVGMVAAA